MLSKSILLVLLLTLCGPVQGQTRYTPEQKLEIRTQTQSLFEELTRLAEKSHYEGFSKKMIYNGLDPNRNLNAKLNYNDPHERLTAINTLNLLRSLMKKSTIWHAADFSIVSGFERDLFIWKVEFTDKKGRLKTRDFVFAKYKGEYLLARTDK